MVQALRQVLKDGPFIEVDYQQVPDEQALIRAKLRVWCDQGNIDLVLTTGGIGLGQRDRTPEATAEVIERHVPGLPEALRAALLDAQPLAALYRALAGVRRGTLIVNLPGTPESASKGLAAVVTALAFAVEEIRATRSRRARCRPASLSNRPTTSSGPQPDPLTTVTVLAFAIFLVAYVVAALGVVLPVLPGVPIAAVGALAAAAIMGFDRFGVNVLIHVGLLAVLSQVVDLAGTWLGSKYYGAGRAGTWGGIIGSFVGLLAFPPWGSCSARWSAPSSPSC